MQIHLKAAAAAVFVGLALASATPVGAGAAAPPVAATTTVDPALPDEPTLLPPNPLDSPEPDDAPVLPDNGEITTAATCTYQGCDYKGPSGTGCSSPATTIARAHVPNTYLGGVIPEVELRWSSTCQAYWARSWSADDGYSSNRYDILIVKRRISDNAVDVWDVMEMRTGGNYNDWTLMAGRQYGYKVRACIRYTGITGWHCTGYVQG